ncbi:DUF2500 domain-containing protein [Neobacillus sp.]|uniref:DUF2500 domain-containing protein n=1 Tax=Neobacillus sp. TaxID=2675273 RepID=UPI0037C87F74
MEEPRLFKGGTPFIYGWGERQYFATFEVESGDRIEFEVMVTEYGMLVEGDNGQLAFQGTRYHGFIRANKNIRIR